MEGQQKPSKEMVMSGKVRVRACSTGLITGFLTKNVIYETRGLPTVMRGRAPHGYPSCAHSTPRDQCWDAQDGGWWLVGRSVQSASPCFPKPSVCMRERGSAKGDGPPK